jgi:hypothetical protein
MRLSINDTQHNNSLHYGACRYAECRVLFTVMLGVIILNVVMLSVMSPKKGSIATKFYFCHKNLAHLFKNWHTCSSLKGDWHVQQNNLIFHFNGIRNLKFWRETTLYMYTKHSIYFHAIGFFTWVTDKKSSSLLIY